MALLDKVKVACRVTVTAYDEELTDMIKEGLDDIGITDVNPALLVYDDDLAPLIRRAVITYCKMNFGFANLPEYQYDRLKESYDEQKKQLLTSSAYRDGTIPPEPQEGTAFLMIERDET